MRFRFGLVIGAFLTGSCLIAACGSSDNTTSIPDDAGAGDATMAETSASGDGGADGALASGPCTAAVAAACGTRKCDVTLGCVQCLANTDCPAADPFCIRGTCEACRTNADC